MGKNGVRILISFQKELRYLDLLSEEFYRFLPVVLNELLKHCRKGSF